MMPRPVDGYSKQSVAGDLAERVGFEPTDPCGSTVFKTVAIDHSATSPNNYYFSGLAMIMPLTESKLRRVKEASVALATAFHS